jgi:2-polyprenyl-3-methyl-5-hydroxy-6-metoxy-1,4-benzoquinol methylase
MNQDEIDNRNALYWDEPCGTPRANRMRLNLKNAQDLDSFDNWYFNFYSYLKRYLEMVTQPHHTTLEVGIGLGTVTRYLANQVYQLDVVDIAPKAIEFTKESLHVSKNTQFFSESILEFEPKKMYDSIIAIGSLHHTGQLEAAITKCESLLKPNGKILIMVYYAFQPRKILLSPFESLRNFFQSLIVEDGNYVYRENKTWLRKKADANSHGEAAPETVFSSRKLFKNRKGMSYEIELNNSHGVPFTNGVFARDFLLKYFSKYFGCDIYAVGSKFVD